MPDLRKWENTGRALETEKEDNLASVASSCQHPANRAPDTPVDLYH